MLAEVQWLMSVLPHALRLRELFLHACFLMMEKGLWPWISYAFSGIKTRSEEGAHLC